LVSPEKPIKLTAKVKVDQDGSILIPKAMLKALGIASRDLVDLRVQNYELRVSPVKPAGEEPPAHRDQQNDRVEPPNAKRAEAEAPALPTKSPSETSVP
jgi:bifunctional DNA-binding transcriptional regulator/antitoxin component of YhaV-PrlF toxin-antitoxin module